MSACATPGCERKCPPGMSLCPTCLQRYVVLGFGVAAPERPADLPRYVPDIRKGRQTA